MSPFFGTKHTPIGQHRLQNTHSFPFEIGGLYPVLRGVMLRLRWMNPGTSRNSDSSQNDATPRDPELECSHFFQALQHHPYTSSKPGCLPSFYLPCIWIPLLIPLLLFVTLDASKSADLEEKSNLALKESDAIFTIKRIFGSSRQSGPISS